MTAFLTGCINLKFHPSLLLRAFAELLVMRLCTNCLLMSVLCMLLSLFTIEMALFLLFLIFVKLSRYRRVAVENTLTSLFHRFTFSAFYICRCLLVILLRFSCELIPAAILDSRLPVEMLSSFKSLLSASVDCDVNEPLVLTVVTTNG